MPVSPCVRFQNCSCLSEQISASIQIWLIVSTHYLENYPFAVSPDNIVASEPSKMALATSEASALVGLGLLIIDSIIYVAVTTGFPASKAFLIIIF